MVKIDELRHVTRRGIVKHNPVHNSLISEIKRASKKFDLYVFGDRIMEEEKREGRWLVNNVANDAFRGDGNGDVERNVTRHLTDDEFVAIVKVVPIYEVKRFKDKTHSLGIRVERWRMHSDMPPMMSLQQIKGAQRRTAT